MPIVVAQKKNIQALFDYYEDDGIRELCHRVKQGDIAACVEIADKLVKNQDFPENTVLIPVPSSSGKATSNALICHRIAAQLHCDYQDCIEGASRRSLYAAKKAGETFSQDDFGFHFIKQEPKGHCVLLDVVADTGTTFEAVSQIFSTPPDLVAFAMTDNNKIKQRQRPDDTMTETPHRDPSAPSEQEPQASLRRRQK